MTNPEKKNGVGDKWLVVVNPNAGSGRGKRDWEKISRLLAEAGFRYTHIFTERKNHAMELVIERIEQGFRRIIVVGGDGTLNEVINGIFLQKRFPPAEIITGMIPVGTGNDWGKMFHISSGYREAVAVLKKQQTLYQDAGVARYTESGTEKTRYFINIAGLGFDARVVQKTNRQKDEGKRGAILYFANIFTSLLGYKCTEVSVEIDGEERFRGGVFTISIGNGRYTGGGMLQTPGAEPDDGLLDMTVIRKMWKLRIIMNLKKLYDGKILEHPMIEGFRGRKLRIDSIPPVYVETDGESLGHTPAQFEVLPKSLQVVIGARL